MIFEHWEEIDDLYLILLFKNNVGQFNIQESISILNSKPKLFET